MTRLSWDDYFSAMAETVASRSTCPRRHVGCVLVIDNVPVSTGYNGSVHGEPHCTDVGCQMEHGHCVRTLHAEQNAILHARQSLKGSTAYVTLKPCYTCDKMLRQVGVIRYVHP